MLQTCLVVTFHLVSAETIPTIKPGFLPDCMGQSFNQHESFDIVNSTGFLGIDYLYYGHILVYDYILKPGQNVTILYAEHGGQSSDISGDFQFFHGNNDVSHSGVNIQTTTINATVDSAYSKITILADKDTEQGTYWLIFPPGLCSGGNVILLTIGDSLDLVPQIGTLKAHIENHEKDDVVVINSSPYVLANLTLLDPAGKIERAYEIMVDPNGNSARWFTPTQNGNYTAVITSAIGNMTIPFTVSGVEKPLQVIGNTINLSDSPLKQFKSGIKTEDVKCTDGFTLVIKSEDDSPACVKPDTAQKLIERGWAKKIVTKTTINAIPSSMSKLEIPVMINGVNSDYSFNYTITGGQIEQATADITNKELILSIKSTGNGTLLADLPRTLIDAKMNGQDSPFIVLEDKKEVRYNQTTTIQSRILSIPFQYGVSRIEIVAPVPIQ